MDDAHLSIVTIRGTERYHMEEYLLNQGYRQESPNSFISSRIRVVFTAQRKIALGRISITEIEVRFSGDKESVESESERFKLRFMTAGG